MLWLNTDAGIISLYFVLSCPVLVVSCIPTCIYYCVVLLSDFSAALEAVVLCLATNLLLTSPHSREVRGFSA